MSENEALEAAEATIAGLPGPGPGLDDDGMHAFRRARRRLSRHHCAWRDGMPALDTLFDDDCHRARALAGSLCTELEDVLVAWGETRAAVGPPDEAAERFILESTDRWRQAAGSVGECQGWDDEAGEAFRGFVDDLAARAGERGLAALAGEGAARPLPPPRWLVVVRRVLRIPAVALRRFLRPDLP